MAPSNANADNVAGSGPQILTRKLSPTFWRMQPITQSPKREQTKTLKKVSLQPSQTTRRTLILIIVIIVNETSENTRLHGFEGWERNGYRGVDSAPPL